MQKFSRWSPLFLISSLSLFIELAVIRWVSGEIRLISYFKNLPLLAAFLGLSIGFALVGKGRDYRPSFAPLFTLLVVLVLVVGRASSPLPLAYPGGGDEFLWYAEPVSGWLALGLFLGAVLILFLMIMFLFIPLGQSVGEEMAIHRPIPAYLVNVLASLIGVWAFSLISYFQTPPVIWFGLAIVGMWAYFVHIQVSSRVTLTFLLVALAGLTLSGYKTIWSPYQKLTISELYQPRRSDGELVKVGYTLEVQQVFHQYALDLSDKFLNEFGEEIPGLEETALSYNLPYRLVPEGSRVLVVGAGMGNDVAASLRNHASHVDAVEIDPAILGLGHELHPERPYDDPRVTPIVDDARSFFNESSARYDAIVFGLLDSHTLLSSLSSVRLDSFVYTIESFEQVRDHLNTDGVVVVTFITGTSWLEERLGRILIKIFDSDRVFVHSVKAATTFVAGDITPDQMDGAQLSAWQPDPQYDNLPLSTDDWPYLYLRTRKIPAVYWQALIVIGIVCLAFTARYFPETLRPDWHFWLLGAAFLLIEFKSITELALLFGSTWLVNALAISGVLVMVLVANLFVLWRPRLNLGLVYALLLISLVLMYFFPLNWLARLSVVARVLGSTTLLSLPLLFAGMIFAESLRRAGETSGPLASNLSGTMMGGFLEYGSLIWGIKSLYIIAIGLYVGAGIASLRR